MPRSAAPWSTYAGTSAGRTSTTRSPFRSTRSLRPSSGALSFARPALASSFREPGRSAPVGKAIEILFEERAGNSLLAPRGGGKPGSHLVRSQPAGTAAGYRPGHRRHAVAVQQVGGSERLAPCECLLPVARPGVGDRPYAE